MRLNPVLEQLAQSYAGRFLLVNLNTDEHRQLAKTYGVTSLPTIKLFLNGAVVETRHGYQDEADMQYLLARYMPRESDRTLTEAVKTYQQGDAEQAMTMLAQAIIEDPRNIRLPLTMARLMVGEGRSGEAERLLANMPPEQRDAAQARLLRGELALIRVSEQAPAPDSLLDQMNSDEDALEPRYQLAAHYFVDGKHAEAMRLLFEVLQADRQFQQGDGRIFANGPGQPLGRGRGSFR